MCSSKICAPIRLPLRYFSSSRDSLSKGGIRRGHRCSTYSRILQDTWPRLCKKQLSAKHTILRQHSWHTVSVGRWEVAPGKKHSRAFAIGRALVWGGSLWPEFLFLWETCIGRHEQISKLCPLLQSVVQFVRILRRGCGCGCGCSCRMFLHFNCLRKAKRTTAPFLSRVNCGIRDQRHSSPQGFLVLIDEGHNFSVWQISTLKMISLLLFFFMSLPLNGTLQQT